METYFGTDYMEFFRDTLSRVLTFADYKNMMTGLGLVDDFKQYTDSSPDPNAGDDAWTYHFPNKVVPADIKKIYDELPFDRLIESTSGYGVEYKRSYSMKAVLRVYDKRGIYGTTESKDISIN